MRSLGLRLLYGLGALTATIPLFPIVIFVIAWRRRQRAFHPNGTVCRAEVTALDQTVGPRIAGPAIVRLSTVSGLENALPQGIMGLAFAFGDDPARPQNLALATFTAFLKLGEATKAMVMASYFANEFSTVTPWQTEGHGAVWYRAVPLPGSTAPQAGTRVERIDAAIAAGTAGFTLAIHSGPAPTDALIATVAQVKLVERLADPQAGKDFRVGMGHAARGISPTGFRNGIRVVAYPVSQLARRVRGG